MRIRLIKHDIYIPSRPDVLTIYLKNYKNSYNIVENLIKGRSTKSTESLIHIDEKLQTITFNITQTSLHLLYKSIRKFKGINVIYVRCKYMKYSLDDIIEYMVNLGTNVKVKKLIFLI